MKNKNTFLILSLVLFSCVCVLVNGGAIFFNTNKSDNSNKKIENAVVVTGNTNSITTEDTNTLVVTKADYNNGKFKDGSYSTSVNYYGDDSSEYIKVSIQVKSDKVTSLIVENSKNDRKSIQYQERFENSINDLVIDKSLQDINLSRVAGASDTTNAFMNALNQIKSQAQL